MLIVFELGLPSRRIYGFKPLCLSPKFVTQSRVILQVSQKLMGLVGSFRQLLTFYKLCLMSFQVGVGIPKLHTQG
jgi:hypothetical protein